MLFLLHSFKPYTCQKPSKIRPTAAIDKGKGGANTIIILEGEGFLHNPAQNKIEYIAIKTYNLPFLASKFSGGNSIMGDTIFKQTICSKYTISVE